MIGLKLVLLLVCGCASRAHYDGDAPRPKWFVRNGQGGDIRPLAALDGTRAGDAISWLPLPASP
jgi:hypothetical protein